MGTRAQSSAAVAPTLCTPRTRSLHRIALRNISGGEHGFRLARFLDVLGSEVRYRRAHRPPRQRAAHPRALSSGRQPCAIPGAGMCVADFPHAPARLCAQRMTAPFRLRSRAYLDRSGLSSAVLLRVVGLARSHSAPSASARSRSSSPPLKRSSSSTRRRSIALGPVGFRSIALLLLTSAQALLVVSRPDDASDGTPSPCSCSTASPSRSPARCGAARVRPRVRQRLAPCAAYARAYREGAVVTCPGSARAAYLFLPVGFALCMRAMLYISAISCRLHHAFKRKRP